MRLIQPKRNSIWGGGGRREWNTANATVSRPPWGDGAQGDAGKPGATPHSPSRRARAGGEAQPFPNSPVNNRLRPPRSRLSPAILPSLTLPSLPLPPAGRRALLATFWCASLPRACHLMARRRRDAVIPLPSIFPVGRFSLFFFVCLSGCFKVCCWVWWFFLFVVCLFCLFFLFGELVWAWDGGEFRGSAGFVLRRPELHSSHSSWIFPGSSVRGRTRGGLA